MERIPITNSDGTATAVHYFPAAEGSNRPVVIIYPAMGVKAAFYDGLGQALAASGIPAVTADLRGKGESGIRPSAKVDFGYREMIGEDLSSVVDTVSELLPSNKIVLLGHSLGGQLGCLYASRYPGRIHGLILVACCSVYYKGWSGLARYRILMGTQFAGALATVMGYFPGRRVGFGGTNAKSTMQDWSRQSRTGKYRLKGDPFDYEAALARLDLPVLTISFEGDDFAPYEAVEHLVGKFAPEAPVKKVHLGYSDPLNSKYNHFNWPKKPGNIVRLVNEWLEGSLS